ncbi:MAG TPA: M23 family metallopeptidase, partial [Candidatus Limnocylindrales bacterium]|nr:M23 family metallopeptidase [Candidatus Limnocylindrales bacterium]
MRKKRLWPKICYLTMGCLLVMTAIHLASLLSRPVTTAYFPKIEELQPESKDINLALVGELHLYPDQIAPGDFFILEATFIPASSTAEILTALPSTFSTQYRAGEGLFVIIGVHWESEPGTYQVNLAVTHANGKTDQLTAMLHVTAREFQTSRFNMPPGTTAGWTAARLDEDRERVRKAREYTTEYPLWLQPFIVPITGRISSEFGAIRIINNNPPRRHRGIDITTDEGAPIVAPNSGIVRLADFLLSGGNTVIIDHGLGLSSTYMHLQTIAVETGQLIERGQLIGTLGETGFATGPHLHWEVNIGQTPINPKMLIRNDLL